MRYRRVDPHPYEYDGALRTALHMAADSVEPGAGGLDEIRAKIAAKQSARRKLGWWAAAAQDQGRPWWHALLPPRGWFPAVVGAVTERFRPDPLRAGWFIWLRPAAAVFTGLFVATAASWAVAALPSALSGSKPTQHQTSPGMTHKPKHSASGSQGYTNTTGGGTTPSGQGSSGGSTGATTPSCSPTPSGSPTTSPSGSPSPTTTPSGSPSPTTTPSGTPPPTSTSTTPTQNTPTGSPTPGGASSGTSPAAASAAVNRPAPANSPEATGKALLSPDVIAATELAATSQSGRLAEPRIAEAVGVGLGAVLPTTQPTASPTIGSPVPTTTPPPPC